MAAPVTSQSHGRSTLSARVLKIMGLFSGVQVATILCSVIRTKLVAIWLGPAGMGLFGLYYSMLETISSLTGLGSGTGIVRVLAISPREAIPRLTAVIRRWAWGLGAMGALLTLLLAPWLSRFTFGDDTHAGGFMWLSGGILLLTLSNTEGAVFQGLKRYARLARSTVGGAVAGLVLSVPMLYFWGTDSIIPVLLVYVVTSWLFRGLFRENTGRPEGGPIGMRETIVTGKEFALLGIFMTITAFATNAISYIFMSYLNREAGTETAGYYQAGFTLVNRYVGLVLTAIGMEYLPRLSEVSAHPRRIELFLSHEIILIMLILFPVVTVFLAADRLLVGILYDREFQVMLPFITWAVIGTVFRAYSWCLAFVILAKGDGVTFLCTELLSSLVAIGLNIFFFDRFGIVGMGYAYTLWYAFYLLEIWAVCRWRYHLSVNRTALLLPFGVFAICAVTAIARSAGGWLWTLPFVALSMAISIAGLKRLLGAGPRELLKKFAKPAKKG